MSRGPLADRALPRICAALVVVGMSLSGCEAISPSSSTQPTAAASGPSARPAASTPGEGSATASPTAQIDHVLAISVDALNPTAITELGPERTPTFHRLMREGAWTFNARTEQERTITLPNHTGMLTGRRVARSQDGHGVWFNTDNGTTVHTAAGMYVSSVFDVVHDHGGRTALFAAKDKFAFFGRTWNAAGAPDRVGADNGSRKIDRVVLDENNTRLVGRLDAELGTADRTFTFLHVSLPDVAGHAHGFMGKQYLAAVERTDVLLGRVLAAIDADPELKQHLALIVTADHGGLGVNHTDPTRLADYRIPFLVWGPGVPAGADLYAMNPDYRDPGKSRPGYSGAQPIRNGDLANLTAGVLGLPAVPGSQLDQAQDLTVFG